MSEIAVVQKEINARLNGYKCFVTKPDIGDPNGMQRFFKRILAKLTEPAECQIPT